MPPLITLALVDTSTHVLTRAAIETTIGHFPVARVLVATDQPERFSGFDTVRIEPFPRINDYNHYVTHKLLEHITTEVTLIAHYDGFVINPQEYSPHFAHYDYIGAPWPMFDVFAVGNGGFSWRSRRLLEAVASTDYDGEEPEDLFICRTKRIHLETRHKIRFADAALASHFSQELSLKPYPSFGFHGIFHLPSIYARNLDFLIENLTARILLHPISAPQLAKHIGSISPAMLKRFEQRRLAVQEHDTEAQQ